jgi:hypothetical protein
MADIQGAGAPVAVLIETDLSVVAASKSPTLNESTTGAAGQQRMVRRPMRGIQLKSETFATLALSSSVLNLKNSSAPSTGASFTSNFLLQSVSEGRQEKFQTVPTFGATYGFFYGEQPRIVSCQAILLNTADFQWEAEWWENYDQYLRGTRLVDRGMTVTLTYEDVVLEGYLVSASVSKGEPNPWAVNLSFNMWVTRVTYLISPVGAGNIDPIHLRATQTQYDEFESSEGLGSAPSMLAEVRARNIASLASGEATGLLGALARAAHAVQELSDRVSTAVDNALDWLYGRNMVIPVGFATSDDQPGVAMMADGSGMVLLPNGLTAGTATIRAPIRVAPLVQVVGDFNYFDHNVDEYPARFQAGVQLLDISVMESADPAIAFAEKMFKNFGIDVSNDEGQQTSAVMQALGRVTFAAISYTATVITSSDTEGT